MPDDKILLPKASHWLSWRTAIWTGGIIIALAFISLIAVRVAYNGKLLPGSQAYGIYIGGMGETEAKHYLTQETNHYATTGNLTINLKDGAPLALQNTEIDLAYNTDPVVDQLSKIGNQGSIFEQFSQQISLMMGHYRVNEPPPSFDSHKLYSKLTNAYTSLDQPAKNARYNLNADHVLTITPQVDGSRLALMQFLTDATSVWNRLENGAVTIQADQQPAAVTQARLEGRANQLTSLGGEPLRLKYDNQSWTVPSDTVLSWYSYSQEPGPVRSDLPNNFYQPLLRRSYQGIALDSRQVNNYLSTTLGKTINQSPIDARLSYQNGQLVVLENSQDGHEIDTNHTVANIMESLKQPSIPTVNVVVKTQKAEINEGNLESLGITGLLSEGVSYFPGSSANRITNVRVGAARYQNVLLKPDQVFSFGALLGPVGPEQGYKEGHVILEGRQENEYGGGLCQVSSTAFRAALMAGLPILERYNHAFAVSYYTAPYGVPGVDATIYYPSVDFKFRNDTGHYILIQTELVGTTLKFRYYGTKQKEGVIRGPNFVYGSNDPNQASRTVFYRDIKVGDTVIKTDTFYTNYKPATDYPSVD